MEDGIQRVEAHVLDHIGIASDVIDELNLVQIIDSIIPKKASHYRITHGQAVKAIILSGLGFQERRLYSVDRFFKCRPVETIFGRGITWDCFSDDTLGETLDKIHEYGVDKFFSSISSRIIVNNQYIYNHFSNIDTSSLSLTGKFKNKDSEIRPLKGHSKDKRPDLLQLILSMAITGPAKIPFWMNVDNGNTSDRELLPKMMERIEEFKVLMFGANDKSITVADSSLFSRNFVNKFYSKTKWITRLSESYQIAKDLLGESLLVEKWNKFGQYRYFSRLVNYNNCILKAIVVHHRKSSYREIGTMRKNYIKAGKSLKKVIKRLHKKVFKNKRAIEKEIEKLVDSYPEFNFKWGIENKRVKYYVSGVIKKKCIRFKNDGYKVIINYRINKDKVTSLANRKGKFILITNIGLDKGSRSDVKIIAAYKKQNNVERGFRFIKDKSFGLSQIHLKRPGRIAALICTMVLTLLVNNFGEYSIREKIKMKGTLLQNQLGVKTRTPTLKWLFQKFQDIVQVKIFFKKKVQTFYCNIDTEHVNLIKCLGKHAQLFYGLT